MDLSNMSPVELQKLKANIEKEISGREKQRRGKAMEEIRSIVAKYGLKLEEVMGKPTSPKSPGVKGPKTAMQKSTKKPALIVYRHPENPELTWGGGRGRRPQWIKVWEASGRSIEEARVSNI